MLGFLFVTLGSEVTQGELTGIDHSVREVAQGNRSPMAHAFFRSISMLGSKPLFLVVGIGVAWLISNRNKALVLLLLLGAVLSRGLVYALKEGFGVARPPLAAAQSLSYPSGHVAGAAAVSVVLSYVAWRNRRWPRTVTAFCATLLVLMAMSRVYLDKHWFSDTVGGALIGGAIGLVTCAVYEWTLRFNARELRARDAVPPTAD